MMNSKVTLIDDLPDLDQLEPSMYNNQMNNMVPVSEIERVQKFIRNNKYNPQPGSGMQLHNEPKTGYLEQNPYMMEQYQEQMPMLRDVSPTPISCADIYKHIENCPICGKLYNNDKTIYIILIIFLTVICIILLKKVLDV
jgi:hypothetical protein